MGKVPANLRASIGGQAVTPSYLERLAAKHREQLTPLTAVAVIMVDNQGNVALGSLLDHNGYDSLEDSPIVAGPMLLTDLGHYGDQTPFESAVAKFLEA